MFCTKRVGDRRARRTNGILGGSELNTTISRSTAGTLASQDILLPHIRHDARPAVLFTARGSSHSELWGDRSLLPLASQWSRARYLSVSHLTRML